MPIPNSNEIIDATIPLNIKNETFITKFDFSTRFPFIKRSAVRDLNLSSEFSLILIEVIYKSNKEFLIFEIRDELDYEIILGNYPINVSKINL